jgi:hypothetical protein
MNARWKAWRDALFPLTVIIVVGIGAYHVLKGHPEDKPEDPKPPLRRGLPRRGRTGDLPMTIEQPKLGYMEHLGEGRHRVHIGDCYYAWGLNQEDAQRLSDRLTEAVKMKKLLKAIEWSGDVHTYAACPACHGLQPDQLPEGPEFAHMRAQHHEGHKPRCRLAKLAGV